MGSSSAHSRGTSTRASVRERDSVRLWSCRCACTMPFPAFRISGKGFRGSSFRVTRQRLTGQFTQHSSLGGSWFRDQFQRLA